MDRRSQERSLSRRGRLILPSLLAVASVSMLSIYVIAQEPRLRLRNVPQRLLNRFQKPEQPQATNAKTGKESSGNADKAIDPTASAKINSQKPALGDESESQVPALQTAGEAMTESIETAPTDLSVVSLPPVDSLASEVPAQESQPLVLATEAEKNQEIAKGWPEPWACFFITGRQHGYIEPCGCTGLENQKGGLNRRDTLLSQLKERGWNMVPVDAGDQVRRQGVQQELKLSSTIEAFKQMEYAAVGFGPEELQLNATNLFLHMNDVKGNFKSQFVSANVAVLVSEAPERYKVIKLPNGRTIGITSVLGDDYAKEIQSQEIMVQPAVDALKPIANKLKSLKCDYYVLIANGSLEETRRIAQAVPSFDLVVTAGGHGEPLYKPEPIAGTDSIMVQVGVKGMYAGILGLYDDPSEPFRYQRIALSGQFEDSPRIMDLFAKYQETLKRTGFKDLGLTPLTHPTTRSFVGSSACKDCHSDAYEVWENSLHAHATDSIVSPPGRGNVARHFDPECVSCHVTGWNPQGYYPYRTGYTSMEATSHLTGNGCENCHGPGSAHVDYENGAGAQDDQLRDKLREEMRLSIDTARDKCLECHDLDNSPAFHKDGAFEDYWAEIAH